MVYVGVTVIALDIVPQSTLAASSVPFVEVLDLLSGVGGGMVVVFFVVISGPDAERVDHAADAWPLVRSAGVPAGSSGAGQPLRRARRRAGRDGRACKRARADELQQSLSRGSLSSRSYHRRQPATVLCRALALALIRRRDRGGVSVRCCGWAWWRRFGIHVLRRRLQAIHARTRPCSGRSAVVSLAAPPRRLWPLRRATHERASSVVVLASRSMRTRASVAGRRERRQRSARRWAPRQATRGASAACGSGRATRSSITATRGLRSAPAVARRSMQSSAA